MPPLAIEYRRSVSSDCYIRQFLDRAVGAVTSPMSGIDAASKMCPRRWQGTSGTPPLLTAPRKAISCARNLLERDVGDVVHRRGDRGRYHSPLTQRAEA